MNSAVRAVIVIATTAIVAATAAAAGAAPATRATRQAPAAAGHTAVTALAATPGKQLWARRFLNGVSEGFDAVFMAVGQRGNRLFVTGDAGTVAYNGATGAQAWAARTGPVVPDAVAVSPDGKTVFVAGVGPGTDTATNYATIAYDAATGMQRWASFHDGPTGNGDQAKAVAVSPDGRTVYVTGESADTGGGESYATVAYNAATGGQLWDARYRAGGFMAVFAMALSPNGKTLYITGTSTVAYDAATGQRVWARSTNGGLLTGRALTVSPDGKTVVVAGRSTSATATTVPITVAYRASTGARLWLARYPSPVGAGDFATAVTASSSGRVFVTARSTGRASGQDYVTIAYRTTAGSQVWAKRYSSPGKQDDQPNSVAVSPNGRVVYVTGAAADAYATVAYRASTGAWLGSQRLAPRHQPGGAYVVKVSPDGSRVFVTGQKLDVNSNLSYTTVAYRSQ
jgi:sugar lactone lactonase YvrE